jgi:tetratricopeptide (TPR) repeat protein
LRKKCRKKVIDLTGKKENMKSEERHELKSNELAEWLGNLPEWASENFKFIIGLTAVIVVIVGIYGWKVYYKNVVQARRQEEFTNLIGNISEMKGQIVNAGLSSGSDTSYVLKDAANELNKFAESTSNMDMAAYALIKQAEALRAQLHYGKGVFDADKEQIKNAKAAYELAIQKSTKPVLNAIAEYGLGLCEEELHNFDQAKQIYEKIVANPKYAGITIVADVEFRIKTMSDYQSDITFLPNPVKPKTTLSQPTILPGIKDANSPGLMIPPAETNLPAKVTILPPVEINRP